MCDPASRDGINLACRVGIYNVLALKMTAGEKFGAFRVSGLFPREGLEQSGKIVEVHVRIGVPIEGP